MIVKFSGYGIDAVAGIVYGKRGRPIGRRASCGYQHIITDGKFVSSVHRMIWESAHGPIPAGMQINHINGIKADNRISNLEMVTASQNVAHAYRIGLRSAKGPCNGRAIEKRRRDMAAQQVTA